MKGGKSDLSDNLPADVMQQAEQLFVQGKTVSEVARALKITNTYALYEQLRANSDLIRQRQVHFEIDLELLKYKVIGTLAAALDDEKSVRRLQAATTLMNHIMPKKEKQNGMVVINFAMDPPKMPDAPKYVYEDNQGTVGNE